MSRGKLLIVSGFSGVGKGTVIKELLNMHPGYQLSVSATTRQPRENEKEGEHYFFKSEDDFKRMIQNDELLEYAKYVGNYYGTPRQFVDCNLEKGVNVILEIETKGALQIKEKIPEALLIFILPPDAETLKERLIGRKTETEDVIAARLKKASEEAKIVGNYEYYVMNDNVSDCAENIHGIVSGGSPRLLDGGQVTKIKEDILKMSKGD